MDNFKKELLVLLEDAFRKDYPAQDVDLAPDLITNALAAAVFFIGFDELEEESLSTKESYPARPSAYFHHP